MRGDDMFGRKPGRPREEGDQPFLRWAAIAVFLKCCAAEDVATIIARLSDERTRLRSEAEFTEIEPHQ